MSARDNDDALRARMAALLRTPVPVLRKRLAGLGKDPAGLSKDELVKALATVGAPPTTTPTKAATTAKASRTPRAKPTTRDPRLSTPGTVLEREYKGRAYKVEVLERGFRYDGKEWRSLTAVALAITKYKAISGPLFWGIARPSAPRKATKG